MSCANSVLPVFMAKSSPPDRRGEPPQGQIGTSNNQPKTLTCRRLPGNLGSANRTAMTAYYISNTKITAERAAQAIRAHWTIETPSHYPHDVTMGEAPPRIRSNPGVFARLRSFAY